MKDFLLIIRNNNDYWVQMSQQQQQDHMAKAGDYIRDLAASGKMRGAQPLTMNGAMLAKVNGVFKDGPFVESKEVIGGFFQVAAASLDEAIAIARGYPLFDDPGIRIEIREVMPGPEMG